MDRTLKYSMTVDRNTAMILLIQNYIRVGKMNGILKFGTLFSPSSTTIQINTYTPLPKKNIDTGMGLERMASVIQDVPTNYDTDLFMPIIRAIEEISGEKYGIDTEKDMAFKVIADHIRTVAFAIGDGALPSNEGRGYVLTKITAQSCSFCKKPWH